MSHKFLRLTACLGLLCLSLSSHADSREEQRAQFTQLYAQLKTDPDMSFTASPGTLMRYPLYPWLEYTHINAEFDLVSDMNVLNFIARNPNSLMADRLYARLANRWATKGQWRYVLAYIPVNLEDTEAQCLRLQALANTGHSKQALRLGKPVWMSIEGTMPDACVPVTNLLLSNHLLSIEDYWPRIRQAIERNQTTLASQLAANLPPEQQALVNLRVDMRRAPADTLAIAFKQKDSAYLREIITYGLERLADKDMDTASKLWATAQATFKFTPQESGKVESALGVEEALNLKANAFPRLATISPENRTQTANLWTIRLAARANDWKTVLATVDQLKFDNERDAANWLYWKARALEQTGQVKPARSLYARLATQPSFYGFLAADHLGQDYVGLKQPVVNRQQRMLGIQKIAGIQRAFEWLALGDKDQSRKEWFRVLKMMDREGALAAAELAVHSGEPNLAILTLARIKEWDEVHLRFPLVHTEAVTEQANAQGITPAWVMGVMRRESAFDSQAESSAKAFGLMQLILPTAKTVGNKLGLTIKDRTDVLNPVTNIQLGSAYLKDMLQKFDGNYAQATAAYNAGPGRPLKWAPAVPTNADQWVESIPFTETRDYVQAVMAYTTIYDAKLNPQGGRRLSDRLLPITPVEPKVPLVPVAPFPAAATPPAAPQTEVLNGKPAATF